VRGRCRVVGHHHEGLAHLADRVLEEAQQILAGSGVQCPGRLVGEDDVGPTGQCPGCRDTLLLASGDADSTGGRNAGDRISGESGPCSSASG
jgi:hypothetical protein